MKKVLLIILSLLAFITLTFSGIIYYYGFLHKEEILKQLKIAANQELNGELLFSKADFDLLKSFPQLSVSFEEVYLISGIPISIGGKEMNDTIIRSHTLNLSLNTQKLISGEYIVDKASFEEGYLHLFENERFSNYDLIKDSEQTSDTSSFALNLNDINLKNFDFIYHSDETKVKIHAHLHFLSLSGNFINNATNLQIELKSWVGSINYEGENYFERNPLEFSGNINDTPDFLKITEGHFSSQGLDLYSNLIFDKNSSNTQIEIEAQDQEILTLLELIPNSLFELPENFEITGTCSLSGSYNDMNADPLHLDLQYKGVKVKHPDLPLPGDINGHANYIFSNQEISSLKDIKIQYKDEKNESISLTGDWNNIEKYSFNLSAQGNILIQDLLPQDLNQKTRIDSPVEFSFEIKGNGHDIEDFDQSILANMQFFGEVHLPEMQYTEDEPIKMKSCALQIAGDDLKLSETEIAYKGQNIDLKNLFIKGWKNELLATSNTTEIEAKIISQKLNLNSLLPEDDKNEEASSHISLPKSYLSRISISIDTLIYQKLELRNVNALAHTSYRKLNLEIQNLKTLNGTIEAEALLKELAGKKYELLLESNLNEIDLHELLYSLNDPWESTLSSDEITGDLSGQLRYKGITDSTWVLDNKSNQGTFDFRVEKGELYDLRSLQKLANTTKLDELNHIQFQKLEGQISLNQNLISINDFILHSNVTDLRVSGNYQLEKNMDIGIELDLDPIIKQRRGDNEKIYLKAEGTIEDYSLSYDFSKKREINRNRLKNEKENLKEALKKEFSKEEGQDKPKEEKTQEKKSRTKVIWE